MHPTSLDNMQAVAERFLEPYALQVKRPVSVMDIGALDVNGSYRKLFDESRFSYKGVDLVEGKGVDLVLEDPYQLPFADGSFDVVLSGQMLEHSEYFWESFKEMARVVAKDGFLVVIAPSAGPIHRYPVDCYRFYPDGFAALAKWAGMELAECYLDDRSKWGDLVGVFRYPDAVDVEPGSARRTTAAAGFAQLEVVAFTSVRSAEPAHDPVEPTVAKRLVLRHLGASAENADRLVLNKGLPEDLDGFVVGHRDVEKDTPLRLRIRGEGGEFESGPIVRRERPNLVAFYEPSVPPERTLWSGMACRLDLAALPAGEYDMFAVSGDEVVPGMQRLFVEVGEPPANNSPAAADLGESLEIVGFDRSEVAVSQLGAPAPARRLVLRKLGEPVPNADALMQLSSLASNDLDGFVVGQQSVDGETPLRIRLTGDQGVFDSSLVTRRERPNLVSFYSPSLDSSRTLWTGLSCRLNLAGVPAGEYDLAAISGDEVVPGVHRVAVDAAAGSQGPSLFEPALQYGGSAAEENEAHEYALSAVGYHGAGEILDLGCWNGDFLSAAKDLGISGTGMDADPSAIQVASDRGFQANVGNLDDLAWRDAFEGQSFDALVFLDVLEHLLRPDVVLSDSKSLLRAGGIVVASIPNVCHGSLRLSMMAGNWDYANQGLLDRTHVRFFTLRTIETLFKDAGFVIRDVSRVERPVESAGIALPESIKDAASFFATDPEALVFQYLITAQAR